jgi:hypothetical protein
MDELIKLQVSSYSLRSFNLILIGSSGGVMVQFVFLKKSLAINDLHLPTNASHKYFVNI